MSIRRAGSLPPSRRAPRREARAGLTELLDLAALRDRAGHDEALVCELLEDFLARGVGTSQLCSALEAHAFGELATLAHRLRGALLALGARSAGAVAEEVERQAATLAIGTGASDKLSLWVLSLALTELGKRVDEARDAMREVLESATAMTLAASA